MRVNPTRAVVKIPQMTYWALKDPSERNAIATCWAKTDRNPPEGEKKTRGREEKKINASIEVTEFDQVAEQIMH